jgi:arginine decarboxylase
LTPSLFALSRRPGSDFDFKCVDSTKPSCYFSTAAEFFLSPTHGGTHTGTMAFVAKKIFLTKGVGKHRERLSSFELALRNAGIAACNIVRVSSIFPPNCKLISRSEGLKHIKPGQVAFTVISENSTKEAHRLIAASIGLALPSDKSMYGYLSEHHSFGETEEVAGEYAEELAAEMLATTLNVEFDPDLSWDEKKEVYRISNKIVRTMNVTQSAVGDKRGLWTTVLGAAILIGEDD